MLILCFPTFNYCVQALCLKNYSIICFQASQPKTIHYFLNLLSETNGEYFCGKELSVPPAQGISLAYKKIYQLKLHEKSPWPSSVTKTGTVEDIVTKVLVCLLVKTQRSSYQNYTPWRTFIRLPQNFL
jgi:hypothetical protein